jgi:hypothetical protein
MRSNKESINDCMVTETASANEMSTNKERFQRGNLGEKRRYDGSSLGLPARYQASRRGAANPHVIHTQSRMAHHQAAT